MEVGGGVLNLPGEYQSGPTVWCRNRLGSSVCGAVVGTVDWHHHRLHPLVFSLHPRPSIGVPDTTTLHTFCSMNNNNNNNATNINVIILFLNTPCLLISGMSIFMMKL